jgi:hypothetical protein
MKRFVKLFFFLCLMFAVSIAQTNSPNVFTLNAKRIAELRDSYQKGLLRNNPIIQKLVRGAEGLLEMKPVSVMDKQIAPPSADKHDYMSMSKYWWPNPDTKDGLPYVRKDGEVNPESAKITDAGNVGKLIYSVELLSLAYYITGNRQYSFKVAELLKVWFLDDNTKMNPNLNYAQSVSGKNEGTKSGIIDTHGFYKLLDAIGLIENSAEWNSTDNYKIKKWFSEYLNWLKTGKNGTAESKSQNNHGTWYDVQIVSISLFVGEHDFAAKYLKDAYINRINSQIKKDGSQPFELIRTKSWQYSLFNLEALFQLAVIGDHLGLDLWNYTNEEGSSLRKALDYILPAAVNLEVWKDQQIVAIETKELFPILLIAKTKFDKQIYGDWIQKIFDKKINSRIENLL